MKKEIINLLDKKTKIFIVALSLFAFGLSLFPRFIDAEKFLPFYSIDENEVVEYGVAMMGEEKSPYWRKYGPLNWYLLSYIYEVQASMSDNHDEYIDKVFFEKNVFYVTARVFNALLNIGMAIFAFFMARKFISKDVAWLIVALLAFPFSDMLGNFTARVDTLLGFCTVAGLFFLLNYFKTKKIYFAGLSGIFIGLAIASKPLPGLLVLPTVFFSFLIYNLFDDKGTSKAKLPIAIKTTFLNPAPYILLVAIFVGNFIGNPYSILEFDIFYAEQLKTIKDDSAYSWAKGYKISKFYTNLGYVFLYLSIVALLVSFVKRFRQVSYFVILSYPLVFFLIFINKPSRLYFYIPIIPLLIIGIGIFLKDFSTKIPKGVILLLILSTLIQPGFRIYDGIQKKRVQKDYTKAHTGLVSTKWAKENIAEGSKILYYGYYVSLPQLVDKNPDNNANLGEFFMYHRYNYEFLKTHYYNAHKKYIASGKIAYNITNMRYDLKQQEPGLYNYCMQQKFQYVIYFL